MTAQKQKGCAEVGSPYLAHSFSVSAHTGLR